MIELSEYLQPISEPFMGSEIITLTKCFKNEWQRFCIYKNERNSNIVRFENRLLISGAVDTYEVLQFAKMTGIKYIEGLRQDFIGETESEIHSIMVYEGTAENCEPNYISSHVKEIFNILKVSDISFAENIEYDYWLSFIKSKQKNGLCSLFLCEDSATAAVSARGLNFSLISDIATIPEMQNKGLATTLLSSICSDEKLNGFTPFVVSKNVLTDGFYEKSNFKKHEEKLIINL